MSQLDRGRWTRVELTFTWSPAVGEVGYVPDTPLLQLLDAVAALERLTTLNPACLASRRTRLEVD